MFVYIYIYVCVIFLQIRSIIHVQINFSLFIIQIIREPTFIVKQSNHSDIPKQHVKVSFISMLSFPRVEHVSHVHAYVHRPPTHGDLCMSVLMACLIVCNNGLSMQIDHSLFSHSLVDEHLDCFIYFFLFFVQTSL